MWDIVLEFLAYLGIRAFKKDKKEDSGLGSHEVTGRGQDPDNSGKETGEGVSTCAGCSRPVEEGVIYELGKAWCRDCYKTHVLKVKD